MLDPELLEILVCPETKEPVHLAEDDLLDRINRSIQEGRIRTRNGDEVRETLDAALLRADGRLLYPIRDGIPVMLVDEAIPLDTNP